MKSHSGRPATVIAARIHNPSRRKLAGFAPVTAEFSSLTAKFPFSRLPKSTQRSINDQRKRGGGIAGTEGLSRRVGRAKQAEDRIRRAY